MRIMAEKGLTLVELLMAIAIFGLIATGATTLLSASLGAQAQGEANYKLYQEGLIIMERLTGEVRRSTLLHIPNAHNSTRDILAISGAYNDDNDYYFGDTLFPRIDEDPQDDIEDDGESGIDSIDDDGDGSVDEESASDDDEDNSADEDPLDGVDNDGDGNIDEDMPDDVTGDTEAGIAGIDDDGDGSVDEGQTNDDDEDGSRDEDPFNPVIYLFDSGTNTLKKSVPHLGQTLDLSTRVSAFQVTFEAPAWILIELTLTSADGAAVTFSEYASPRNRYQKTGKRVK